MEKKRQVTIKIDERNNENSEQKNRYGKIQLANSRSMQTYILLKQKKINLKKQKTR